MKTLVKMVYGSHLYGTNTPESDRDFKGVHLPSSREILLGIAPRSIQEKTKHQREQAVDGHISKNLPTDTDYESRTLLFFMEGLIAGDPIVRAMIFAPEDCILEQNYRWTILLNHKEKFLHKNIDAAMDYCNRQVRKYGTKGSRVAELRKLVEFLKSKDPNTKLFEYLLDLEELAKGSSHISIKYSKEPNQPYWNMLCFDNTQMNLTAKVNKALYPFRSMLMQYGQRALLAEKNQGIDWKAVSHAIRVYDETLELLQWGTIQYPSKDADYLKRVKRGEVPFNEVSVMMEELKETIKRAQVKSDLPLEPNVSFMQALVCDMYAEQVRSYK